PIDGDRGPPIIQDVDRFGPSIHHGFHRQDHAWTQGFQCSWTAVVGNLGSLVELPADAVPDEVPDHAEPQRLHVGLDRVTDVADPVSWPDGPDAGLERLAGGLGEPPGLLGDLTHEHGTGRIPVEALHRDPEVELHQISLDQLPGPAGDAVHHLVVDAGAEDG